jgi:hypothetical protein
MITATIQMTPNQVKEEEVTLSRITVVVVGCLSSSSNNKVEVAVGSHLVRGSLVVVEGVARKFDSSGIRAVQGVLLLEMDRFLSCTLYFHDQ